MSVFAREFVYRPLEKVYVSAYGLNYAGTVIRCVWEEGTVLYDVEYCADGEIKRREFYANQLAKTGGVV
jgi:hypothetical protein